MANRFLNNIRINDAYTFPASDGNDGQVITTDGAGNLAFENVSPDAASVIYRDNFTGDGSTVTFDLQNSITDEDQTQIYIDGVYQEKSTYSISGTTITFTTAPILGHSVEVISISSINTGPTVLYQDNFTGNGNDTAFTLGQIIDNEIKTFIFLNGVYQFKNTYTVDGTTLTFDTAPANGVAIEVVSIASAVQSDSLEAGSVIIPVKNTHTASISKGTPVYITGNVGASERLQIAPADASNSAKMPAAGLLLTTLAVNAEGYVITGGYLRNLTTDTIDGTSTSSNDTVYVKSGGGLTMTKPTGSNLIQNIAKVARSASGNSGSLIVSSILRTNDIPNLTTGKIWVGSANNTIESGTLHLDESNNRLGINNTSPSYSLDVTGDANISSNVIVGGNLTVQGTETILNTQTVEVEDNILQLNTTQGSPDTATATTSGISVYRGNGVTQASFIFDDADDAWDLTNNLVVDGHVGIGDASLSTKFTVNALANSSNNDTPLTVSTIRGGITGNVRNTELLIQSTRSDTGANRNIILKSQDVGGTSRNLILDASAVGIGTSSPSAKLEVAGDVLVASGEYISWGGVGQTSIEGSTVSNKLQFRTGSADRMIINNTGVGIGTTSPAAKLHLYVNSANDDTFHIFNGSVRTHLLASESSNGVIYMRNSSNSNTVRINTSGNSYFNGGNVGIGETSPDNKLHIKGGSVTRLKIESSGSNAGVLLTENGSDKWSVASVSGGSFQLYSEAAGATRFAIDTSGNVGIGTTSPRSITNHTSLTVNGTSVGRVDLAYGGTISASLYSNNSATGLQTESALPLVFSTNSTERMRITTSADPIIRIADGDNEQKAAIRLGGENAGGGRLYFEYNGDDSYIDSYGGHGSTQRYRDLTIGARNLKLLTGNTSGGTRMYIDVNGNVGIGTTSPSAKLDVRNDDGVGNGLHLISDFSRAGGADAQLILGYFANGSAVTGPVVYAANSYPLLFSSGSVERMRIESTGVMKFSNNATSTGDVGTIAHYTNNYMYIRGGTAGLAIGDDGFDVSIYLNNDDNISFNTNGAEKMRLTSVGELLKGITSAAGIGATPADANSTEIGNGYINLARDDTADAKQILFGKNGVRHSFIETTGVGLTFHYGTTGVANLRDNGDGGIWSSETVGRSMGMCSGTNYASGANHAFVKFEGGANSNVVIVANQNGVQLTRNSTSWSSNSDERLKENITSLNNVLDKIADYRCVEYNFINDETEDKKIGFIAQDWQEDFPAVVDNNKNDMLTMKYTETIPILLKAIQELKAEVETLKNQINGIN